MRKKNVKTGTGKPCRKNRRQCYLFLCSGGVFRGRPKTSKNLCSGAVYGRRTGGGYHRIRGPKKTAAVEPKPARQLHLVSSFLFDEGREIGTIIVFSDITELAELKVRYAHDIEMLLDSLVKALSTAIDERSHYNANHTRNMVRMAEAFLDWMEKNGNPWKYDDTRRRVFVMSVGLQILEQ